MVNWSLSVYIWISNYLESIKARKNWVTPRDAGSLEKSYGMLSIYISRSQSKSAMSGTNSLSILWFSDSLVQETSLSEVYSSPVFNHDVHYKINCETSIIRFLVSQGLQLMSVQNNKSDVKETQMIFWRLKKSIKILQIKS